MRIAQYRGLRHVRTRQLLMLSLGLVVLALAGCAEVSTQPTYLYGQRPAEFTYPQAPRLTPLQQVEGFFTDPFHWPETLDPAT